MFKVLKSQLSVLLSILLSWPIMAFGIALSSYAVLPPWARSLVARILNTPEDVLSPIAHVVAPLFLLSAWTLQMVVAEVGMSMKFNKTFATMNSTFESLINVVEHLVQNGPPQGAHQQVDELKASLQTQIKEAETRLRGEWRFYAAAVIGIVLAAFLTVIATR